MSTLTAISQRISELLAVASLDILVTVSIAALLSLLLWRAAPRYRYLLWLLVLGRLLVPVHLELPTGVLPQRADLSVPPSSQAPLPPSPVQPVVSLRSAVRQEHEGAPARLIAFPTGEQEPAPVTLAPSQPPVSEGAVQEMVPPAGPRQEARAMTSASGVALPAVLWLTGVLVLAAVVAYRSLLARRLLRSCRPVQRPELHELVTAISARLGLRRRVRVLCADDDLGLPVPGVLGILRPVVVLPEGMTRDWSTRELESLLVHELAHIRRFDPLINGVQSWLQVLLFFHPLVWFLSWRLRYERELACDDEVVAYYRGRSLPYLRSLLRFAEVRATLPRLRPATVGLAEPTSTLERRMRRMRSRRYQALSTGRRLLSLTAVLLLAGISFALAARPARQLQLSGLVASEEPVEVIELRVWELSRELLDEPQRLREPLSEEQIEPGQPFSVAVSPSALPVIVEVTADGHVAAAFDVVLPEQARLPALFLRRGRAAQVVLEQGGKPAAEALISATILCEQSALVFRYPGRWYPVIPRQRTDQSGRAECVLPELAGWVQLDGVAADGSWGTLRQQVIGSDLLHLRLDARPLTVMVVDQRGQPLSGVPVAEVSAPAGTAVRSDEQGKATLYLPAAGEHQLVALDRDRAGWLTLAPGHGKEAVAITLGPARMLEVDWQDTGETIALQASWLPQALLASPLIASGGSARLPLLSSRGVLTALAPGLASANADVSPDSESVTLQLAPACRVRGMVQSAAGEPLAGVPVWASVPPLRSGWGSFQPPPQRPWLPWAVSAADGSVAIDDLPASKLELEGRLPNLPPARSGTLEGKAGATLQPVLVLEPGARLAMRIIAPDGEPVPGVLAEVLTGDGYRGRDRVAVRGVRSGEPLMSSRSDEEGVIVLAQAPVAEITLRLSLDGFVPRTLAALEVPATGLDLGDLVLEPGTTLSGITVGPQGRPVGNAEVALVFNPEEDRFEPITQSDSSGRFAIHDLEAGRELYLRARAEGLVAGPPTKVVLPSTGPVEVKMDRERRLSGTVMERGTKSPLPDVKLSLRTFRKQMLGPTSMGGGSYPVGGATSDQHGRFSIPGLAPGSYHLSAMSTEHRRAELEITIAADRDPEEVQVIMEPGLKLAVQVIDPEGQPAAATPVTLEPHDASGQPGYRAMQRDSTDRDGSCTFTGLAEGSYRVSAVSDTGASGSQLGTAGSGEVVTLRLEPGGSIAGTVFDPQGAPAPGIEVQAFSRMVQAKETATTGSDGRFRMAEVAAADWMVIASSESHVPAREQVTVTGGNEVEVELRLEQGGAIEGRVLGLSPAELQRCRIDGRNAGRTQVAPDGSFRLAGVPVGVHTVTALVMPKQRARSAQVEVTASPEPVSVELDFASGVTLSGTVRRGSTAAPGVIVVVSGVTAYGGGSTASDEAGAWQIEGLQQGEYRVELKDQLGKVLSGRQIVVDADMRLDLELPEGAISGIVLTADERLPVDGAALQITGHGDAGIQRQVSTDATGRFLIEDLPDTTYTISVTSARGSTRETVELTGGLSQELTLLVKPDSTLVLQVSEPDGDPAQIILVELLQGGLCNGTRVVCSAGRCPIKQLADGPASLLVTGSRGSALLAVSLPSSEMPVSLRPRAQLRVTAVPGDSGVVWQLRIIDAATGAVVPMWNPFKPGSGEWYAVPDDGLQLDLPSGSYRVEGIAPSGEIEQQLLELAAAATVELSFPAGH